ncbi:MAG TPA: PKD domain-containing protein [Candidatus Binatia bacterium]
MLRPAPLPRLLLVTLALLAVVLGGPARATATTATIGVDGNIHVDGEPFFPIGIYHVSWIGNRQGGKAVPDLHLAADAGFNLFHTTIDARDDTQGLLDAAAARGVYVIGEVPWPANGPAAFVDKWKNHPAIIGWLIADDFNLPYAGPSYNYPPEEIAARNDTLHALAPQHLSYASGGSFPGYRIAEFAGTMDVMGFQSYPLGAQNAPDEYALQENIDSFDWVRDQLAGTGQTFVANPQAYRWNGSRYPTPREARNMLYGALLRGAKGVLWYTMWEGSSRYLPKSAPALWADLANTNRELKSLTPFLLHGTRTELATGHARVHAASWQLGQQLVVAVLSTERNASHAVALDLPPGAVGPALRPFPDRAEGGMSVVAGQLSGTIGPEEVHVYLLDLPVPGNVSPTAAFDVTTPTVAMDEPATLDGTTSSDADGSIVAWEWDLGDGTLASGSSVVHTWTKPGTYFVRLTVRDDAGATGTIIEPVTVGVTSLCAPAPLAGCRDGRTSFVLREPGAAARRSLTFTWSRGTTTLADLGDPTATTEYALCVYDGSGLALATGARPGAKWSRVGTTGYRYKDAGAYPGGIHSARVTSGKNPRLVVKGKGVHLPAATLPLTLPVTAQLVASDGACWQGVYQAGKTTKSTGVLFRGRSG